MSNFKQTWLKVYPFPRGDNNKNKTKKTPKSTWTKYLSQRKLKLGLQISDVTKEPLVCKLKQNPRLFNELFQICS